MTGGTANAAKHGPPRTWLLILMLVLSLAGFADAGYLTAKHLQGAAVPCSITGGCEMVLTSRWAEIAGVPTAGFGAAYYLAVFFLTILYLDSRKAWALNLILALTVVGLATSLVLLYLMAFVIHSYCQYCLASDAVTALLFVLSLIAVLVRRKATVSVILANDQQLTTND